MNAFDLFPLFILVGSIDIRERIIYEKPKHLEQPKEKLKVCTLLICHPPEERIIYELDSAEEQTWGSRDWDGLCTNESIVMGQLLNW